MSNTFVPPAIQPREMMDPPFVLDIQRLVMSYLEPEDLWMLAQVECAIPLVDLGRAARTELQKRGKYRRVYQPGVWSVSQNFEYEFQATAPPEPCYYPLVRSSRPLQNSIPLRGLRLRSLLRCDYMIARANLQNFDATLEELMVGADILADLTEVDLGTCANSLRLLRIDNVKLDIGNKSCLRETHLRPFVGGQLRTLVVATRYDREIWGTLEQLPVETLGAALSESQLGRLTHLSGLRRLTLFSDLSMRTIAIPFLESLTDLTILENNVQLILAPSTRLTSLNIPNIYDFIPHPITRRTLTSLTTEGHPFPPEVLLEMTQLRRLTLLNEADWRYDISPLTLLEELTLNRRITDTHLFRHTRLRKISLRVCSHMFILPRSIEEAHVDTCCSIRRLTNLRKLHVSACLNLGHHTIFWTHLTGLRDMRLNFSTKMPLPLSLRKLRVGLYTHYLRDLTNLVQLRIDDLGKDATKIKELARTLPRLRVLCIDHNSGDLETDFLELSRERRLEIFYCGR